MLGINARHNLRHYINPDANVHRAERFLEHLFYLWVTAELKDNLQKPQSINQQKLATLLWIRTVLNGLDEALHCLQLVLDLSITFF